MNRFFVAAATLVVSSAHAGPFRTEARDRAGMPLAFGMRLTRTLVLDSHLQGWRVEGSAHELRCDEVTSACTVPMLRTRPLAGPTASGRLVHSEPAEVWRGATVGARALMRTGAVSGRAMLVLTALDARGEVVAREEAPALSGTTGFSWKEVSLRVPDTAHTLVVGLELVGPGALYLRAVDLAEADAHR